MSEHAPRSPSSAVRWVPCPGSVELEAQYPNEPTEESMEGDAGHWVLAQMLTTGEIVELGSMAPNGIAVSQEMLDGAELGVATVDRILKDHPEVIQSMSVEKTVRNPTIHADVWGTPDIWFMNWKTMTLHLLDYKFGYGYVDAYENWQLVIYVALILEDLRAKGWRGDSLITVQMTIIQPRWYGQGGQVRSWTVPAIELLPYFQIVRESIDKSFTASGDWCANCLHRHACPTLYRSSRLVMDYIGTVESQHLTDEFLGRELDLLDDMAERIKSLSSGLKLEAESRIKRGKSVHGHAVVMAYGHKSWKGKPEEVAVLGDLMGCDLRKPLDVVTPTQALNKKGIDSDILSEYYETLPKGLKLIKSDKTLAARAFNKGK